MILGQSSSKQMATAASAGKATLDDMFRRAAARRPRAIALMDAPNRESFTDGAPRQLTYAQADRAVSAIAGRLNRMGLQTDSVVGLQMPNTVESVLTFLGILRAGLIAAPLPLLWRSADVVTTLSRLGAKALITTTRIGSVDYGDLAVRMAAEIFPIRYVCGFGSRIADGIVPFNDLLTIETPDPLPSVERAVNAAAHLAVITWDVSENGLVPVARNHFEMLAAGLAVVLEGRIAQDATILSSLSMASFAGIALTVVPWLVSGGTLSLHHPFDAEIFAEQRRDHQCHTVILPGQVVARMAEGGLLAGRHGFGRDGLKTVIAAWRAPERIAISPVWRDSAATLVDVHIFGETALLAASRGSDGKAAPIVLGSVTAPRGAPGAVLVAEIQRTATGTIALRGPMVPRFPFPPGAERGSDPYLTVSADGLVDTGYTCRVEDDAKTVVVTGPPAGIVSFGGYRFVLSELQNLLARVGNDCTLTALPDALSGQRLAGSAPNRDQIQAELAALGVNPLIVDAFRERRVAAS
ncbi:MAG: acyl--CoA ligase [Bradyrhizobiaceae bacterium]|nr:acyl--CoA ligase [Bradyrhizobiaceae bacterium]